MALLNRTLKPIAHCLFTLLALSAIPSFGDDSVESQIVERIQTSKLELAQLEKRIGDVNRQLAKQINEQQKQVIALRTQAADFQRIRDEQLLSLESIKNRVEKWQIQSTYQQHLLRGFMVSSHSVSTEPQDTEMDGNIVLQQAIQDIERRLKPSWSSSSIILGSGDIVPTQLLKLGPTELSYTPKTDVSYIVNRGFDGQVNAAGEFNSTQTLQTGDLFSKGVGYYVFDPSLGSALQLRSSNENLLEHVNKGGMWALPIIAFGLLSLIFALAKGIHLFTLPALDSKLYHKLIGVLHSREKSSAQPVVLEQLTSVLPSANSAQRALIDIALNTEVSPLRDELLLAYLMEYKHTLDRFVGVIATSAAVAPLLGLLGTVSGMISTFKLMTIFGSGDASTVSGGISEALVTTELGLIVAIPSLVASALLARRSKNYSHQLESFAIKLSKVDFAHTSPNKRI